MTAPGFWDRLGVDDGGLPAHLPMGVDEHGRGPANDSDAAYFICWCGDHACPLAEALKVAWRAGLNGGAAENGEDLEVVPAAGTITAGRYAELLACERRIHDFEDQIARAMAGMEGRDG